MSRPSLSRFDRVAQMSKQEEIIARKRQEILEKQKTAELGKAIAAAQNNVGSKTKKKDTNKVVPVVKDTKGKLQNTFCNDGSFLTHFQKILDAAKKDKTEKSDENSETESINNSKSTSSSGSVDDNIEKTPVFRESESRSPLLIQEIPATKSAIPSPLLSPVNLPPFQLNASQQINSTNSVTNFTKTFVSSPNISNYVSVTQKVSQNLTFQKPCPTPYFNPSVPPPVASSSTPLYLIQPPEPLQLHKIPPPKELDLNAIPKPELNLDAIKIPEQEKVFSDNNEQFLPTTLESLVELVAENGDAYEEKIRSRKNDVHLHPSLWFLFDTESEMYMNYRNLVQAYVQHKIKIESNDDKYDPDVCEYHEDSDDEYMKDMMGKNLNNLKRKIEYKTINNNSDEDGGINSNKIRKKKSRWGDKTETLMTPSITAIIQTNFANQNKPILSSIQRTDPALLQYARQNYGTINLTDDDWRKCEEHFKVNLLYQDMMKKREEIDRLAKNGRFKYEYDSDEDITGGTWEHRLRTAEMEATQAWADALTEQSEGKHHIGDFLPPEELKKFMEKYDAKKNNRQPDLSDYKEYKLKEDNIGFQMLQKLGWKEGQGLGAGGDGIVDPVNKAPQRDSNQGLGAGTPSAPDDCDNEYEAYRKRMMLAYRFRPNPLNNPRRAYY